MHLHGGRQDRYSETALSEVHHSGGYLYMREKRGGIFVRNFQSIEGDISLTVVVSVI
jgi:hypothetical protein